MNKTYGISMPRYRWDTSNDSVASSRPLSYNTNTLTTLGIMGQTLIPTYNSLPQGAYGSYDTVNTATITYATSPKLGKQLNPGYKTSMSAKPYTPLGFGKKFTPYDLPNLLLWFNSDDLCREFKSVGQPVDRWLNRVTSQNDLVQATSSQQPTIQQGWNDFPCLSFDGVDDKMTVTLNTTANSNYSIYLFIRLTTRQAAAAQYVFCNDTTVNAPAFRLEAENATYPTAMRTYGSGGFVEIYTPKNQYTHPIMWYFSAKNSATDIFTGGAYPYGFTFAASTTYSVGATNVLALGGYLAGSYTKFEIYEILVFQNVHSLGYEIEILKNYFATKYKMDSFWL